MSALNAPTPSPAGADAPAPREPLGPVLGLGKKDGVALLVAIGVALGVHGTAGARALHTLPYLAELAASVRRDIHDRLNSQVDIDVEKPPPPPPPPPPEPEPEPEPEKPPPVRAEPKPETAPPPAAAEAGKVLTAEPDPDEPVDLTGEGFVTGTGDRFAGGITASSGTAKKAVRNTAASPTGVGTGSKAPLGPVTPPVDLSRPPRLAGAKYWDCGFPAEADAEGINNAKVQLVITVTSEGRAKSVTVLKDPGFGFGRHAKQCAFRKAYEPGLNSFGKAVEMSMPVGISFTR
jgi:periplasmic protein TonB